MAKPIGVPIGGRRRDVVEQIGYLKDGVKLLDFERRYIPTVITLVSEPGR